MPKLPLTSVIDEQTALQYMLDRDIRPDEVGHTLTKDPETGETYHIDKRITKLAQKLNNFEDVELARLLTLSLATPIDTELMGDLIPNIKYGPLNQTQKLYIRDHLATIDPKLVASYVLTNTQNVKLAQQGKFKVSEPIPPHVSAGRPYGPITIEEKMYIHQYEQNVNTNLLAAKYNTSYNNISLAQRGQFKPPIRPIVSKSKFGPLTLDQKMEIFSYRKNERTVDLAIEYNTSHSNIRIAQLGQFKQPKTSRPDKLKLLLDGLTNKGYTLTTGQTVDSLINTILT